MNNISKKIINSFKKFKYKPLANAAIRNHIQHAKEGIGYDFDDSKDNITYSLGASLYLGFIWDSTPEGYEFWENIYNNIDEYESYNINEVIEFIKNKY